LEEFAGSIFLIAAPSGAGKSSLVKELLVRDARLHLSISHTTRPPRPGEQDGREYHFVSREQFNAMRDAGEFLESAEVYGNGYGTSAHWIRSQLAQGNDVILEIDWQGAQQVRKLFPACVDIFILPPSLETLEKRLVGRGTDTQEVIGRRLAAAREDLSHAREFEYVIINDQFSYAVDDLVAVVRSGRCRRQQQFLRRPQILSTLDE
jgi:guanylate kinase